MAGEVVRDCQAGEVEIEVCNGLDNDCDGEIDGGLTAPLGPQQHGVCVGSCLICIGAAGWQAPDYGSISGYEEAGMRCDGLDNDCDGETDEDEESIAARCTSSFSWSK